MALVTDTVLRVHAEESLKQVESQNHELGISSVQQNRAGLEAENEHDGAR